MAVKTDQRIVRAMAELLRVQGYAATSLQQLTGAAQAPIGSIYHHFRGGKREVAAAALRQAGAAYIQLLPMLLDQHADLPAAIDAAFAAAADDIANTGWANMCPVGTVAGEIAETEPELRQVTAAVIASVVLGALGAVTVGLLLANFTHRRWWFSAGRQLLVATIAASATFAVGKIIGVSTS